MSDEDVRNPPSRRREPAKFEPPPWERELFDRLAKSKDENGPEAVEPREQRTGSAETGAEEQGEEEATEVAGARAESARQKSASATESDKPAVDARKIEIMLTGLRAQEPRAEELYWKITMVSGGLSALLGLLVTFWGITAFTSVPDAGGRGVALMGVLVITGLGFVGGGVWLVFKTLRQQGVL